MLSPQQLPCSQLGVCSNGRFQRGVPFLVRAEQTSASSASFQDKAGRRQMLAAGVTIAPWLLLSSQKSTAFAAENTKGYLPVTDKTDGYSFIYPFGWQEVAIEGQDKVFKDVIEPLENVSVNVFPTSKEDIRELGSPKEVAEALIKKVLAPPSQKTQLLDAAELVVALGGGDNGFDLVVVHGDGHGTREQTERMSKAPNFTRHALSTIAIGNGINHIQSSVSPKGKFYTLTTGANERRWGKMKDKLNTVVDSFKIFTVYKT
ncbi:PsbP-like protein 1, chloroplastic [Tanacetum coccineum]